MESKPTTERKESGDHVVTSIRLEADSKDWLHERAIKNDRTMSAELRLIIRAAKDADREASAA